jgi:flagellar motility protein MotE (MotC chaperone)
MFAIIYSLPLCLLVQVLSEETQESAGYKDRSLEQEETIADLETKLKERSDGWQNEKRKYVNEIKHLRHEVRRHIYRG